MSTQLRLVDPPARVVSNRHRTAPPKRARTNAKRARRAAHWDTAWRLDATARQVGRAGLAAAREALNQAAEADLPRAS